ncbi:MAG: taurine dioxygenase, partial [Rhodobacteraceae bacterium]|nr:taurine dioxygenase [Paracoccaceae bacterium]
MLNLQTEKLTPFIGAELTGLNLSQRLTDADCDALYEAITEHQVVFLRDQFMSPETHLHLAESFGDAEPPHPIYPHVEGHPQVMLLDFGPHRKPDTDTWHTDVTYKANPPFASVLYSRTVPPVGGDTLWSSMTAAYDALPESMKTELKGRTAVHDMSDFRNNFSVGEPTGNAEKLTAAHARIGSAIHPMVKHHPVTGRPFLFCNPGFTMQVVGESSTGSRRLLNYLFDHMVQPEFQVRFKWTANAVAIWDNRCTMHCA